MLETIQIQGVSREALQDSSSKIIKGNKKIYSVAFVVC